MTEQARYCSWRAFAAETTRLSDNLRRPDISAPAMLIAGLVNAETENGFVSNASIKEEVKGTSFDSGEQQSAVHALLQDAFDEAFRQTPAGPAFGDPSPAC